MNLINLLILIIFTSFANSDVTPVNTSHPATVETTNQNKLEFSKSKIEDGNEQDKQWRIIGGKDCSIEEYPYLVSFREKETLKHVCGGTLMSSRSVLTSAHCFEGSIKYKPEHVRALIGASNNQRLNTQVIDVERIRSHPRFDEGTHLNDIAVVFLAQEVIKYEGVVNYVKLPTETLPYDLSTICDPNSFRITGYGVTYNHPVIHGNIRTAQFLVSLQLQCATTPYISNEKCLMFSTDAANHNFICTFQGDTDKGPCFRDSGGPLLCGGIQYGIITYGFGCAEKDFPTLYTRVDKYKYFINESAKHFIRSLGQRKSLSPFILLMLIICISSIILRN